MQRFMLPRMLAALRAKAGLNQSQLASRVGVSASAVHQAENDKRYLHEAAFIRYTRALGYATELDALIAGLGALDDAATHRRRKAPRIKRTSHL